MMHFVERPAVLTALKPKLLASGWASGHAVSQMKLGIEPVRPCCAKMQTMGAVRRSHKPQL